MDTGEFLNRYLKDIGLFKTVPSYQKTDYWMTSDFGKVFDNKLQKVGNGSFIPQPGDIYSQYMYNGIVKSYDKDTDTITFFRCKPGNFIHEDWKPGKVTIDSYKRSDIGEDRYYYRPVQTPEVETKPESVAPVVLPNLTPTVSPAPSVVPVIPVAAVPPSTTKTDPIKKVEPIATNPSVKIPDAKNKVIPSTPPSTTKTNPIKKGEPISTTPSVKIPDAKNKVVPGVTKPNLVPSNPVGAAPKVETGSIQSTLINTEKVAPADKGDNWKYKNGETSTQLPEVVVKAKSTDKFLGSLTPSVTKPDLAPSGSIGNIPKVQTGTINGAIFTHHENTKNGNTAAYQTISERNDYYQWADSFLAGKSKWFRAAAEVTSWRAVGAAAANRPNGPFLNDAADKLLQAGNKILFPHNMNNANHIINGTLNSSFTDFNGQNVSFKGLTGKALDYALVQFEQTKVQEFLIQYRMDNPSAEVNSAIESINSSMGMRGSPQNVRDVIKEQFNEERGQKAFDFNNYNDKVKLGQGIIDKLHNK